MRNLILKSDTSPHLPQRQEDTTSQQGIVLIYVLTLIALLASLLSFTQTENIQDLKRLNYILAKEDAKYHLYSGLLLAERLLKEDTNAEDGVGDKWFKFKEGKTFPIVDGGDISIKITDANIIPNLNQLADGTKRDAIFMDQMTTYVQKIDEVKPTYLRAVKDWVDADHIAERAGGAEKSLYLSKNPSYISRNGKIKSLGELKLIEGYKPTMWDDLSSQFSLLPSVYKVNVNTISEPYLRAIFPQASSSMISRVLRARDKSAFVTLGEFYEEFALKEVTNEEDLDVISHYFSVNLKSNINHSSSQGHALFERTNGHIYLRRLTF